MKIDNRWMGWALLVIGIVELLFVGNEGWGAPFMAHEGWGASLRRAGATVGMGLVLLVLLRPGTLARSRQPWLPLIAVASVIAMAWDLNLEWPRMTVTQGVAFIVSGGVMFALGLIVKWMTPQGKTVQRAMSLGLVGIGIAVACIAAMR
jgi:hypothetical protein